MGGCRRYSRRRNVGEGSVGAVGMSTRLWLSCEEVGTILDRLHDGVNYSRIAQELGRHRNTISKQVARWRRGNLIDLYSPAHAGRGVYAGRGNGTGPAHSRAEDANQAR